MFKCMTYCNICYLVDVYVFMLHKWILPIMIFVRVNRPDLFHILYYRELLLRKLFQKHNSFITDIQIIFMYRSIIKK